MVSSETGLPDTFDPNPAGGKNVLWTAALGRETHSTPIIAGGRVFIGTNNDQPRDERHKGDRGVLMCFDEKSGALLWQLVVPKRSEDQYFDWPKSGWSSPVTVEGDKVYSVTNRGEVVCLDARGMANGNDGPFHDEARHMAPAGTDPIAPGPKDGDILWIFDLMSGAGIWPHDAAHSSILIRGPHLYVNSGTGVDNTHRKIRTPDAPSLVVFDKQSGKFLARDREGIAPAIFHSTWSSPSIGSVGGEEILFFCGGNGIVYGFEPLAANATAGAEPASLKKLFQYDPDPEAPKTEVHRFTTNRQEGPSNIYAMPVWENGRLFVAGGGDIFWGKNDAWLHCLALSRTPSGGISCERTWKCALNRHVMSTVAVSAGLVFIADTGRTIHCFDAASGSVLWKHETGAEFWASPLVADGKVYIGNRRGEFFILAAAREKKVLCSVDLGSPISATATAANGAVFVATMDRLIALVSGK